MKTKNIITVSILLVVAILIGSLVATYFSYNNREIAQHRLERMGSEEWF